MPSRCGSRSVRTRSKQACSRACRAATASAATRAHSGDLRARQTTATGDYASALQAVVQLLERKSAALQRIRRQMRLKALLEVWLYVHVPITFALIAALSVHILSVFFYW